MYGVGPLADLRRRLLGLEARLGLADVPQPVFQPLEPEIIDDHLGRAEPVAIEFRYIPPSTATAEEVAAWEAKTELRGDPAAPTRIVIQKYAPDPALDPPRYWSPPIAIPPVEEPQSTHEDAPGAAQFLSEPSPSVPTPPVAPGPSRAPSHLPPVEPEEPATQGAPWHICNWNAFDGWCEIPGCLRRSPLFRSMGRRARGVPVEDALPGLRLPPLPGEGEP